MTFRSLWMLTLCALALGAFAPPARAQNKVTIDTELGWGGLYRAGRWTPLYLTVTAPAPRQAVVDIYTPVAGSQAMRVQQGFAIGPQPTTYAIYLSPPQPYLLNETTVTLRDAGSGRRLAHAVVGDWNAVTAGQPGGTAIDERGILIGMSGRTGASPSLDGEMGAHQAHVGYVSEARLPATPAGYDGLSVLVLNAPDLNRIALDQQRAIADWVRAGGFLVLWPGETPIPESTPLVNLLPCRFGENQAINLPPAEVEAAGLPARFAKQRGRLLQPAPWAQPVPLFNGAATGYRGTAGFGHVVVLPFDAAALPFATDEQADQFWRPILGEVLQLRDKDPNQPYANYGVAGDFARGAALNHALDWIGDIPGAGSFGFGYVAITLIGLMLIVGPVDWFVLKWLGRQPWTWVTISGWIGLVTLGAIYIGHVIKSGDLHYRSVRVIDQVDGAAVATEDLVGIYSPLTDVYQLEYRPEAWWEPAVDMQNYYGRSQGLLNELLCHQDYRGNRPQRLRINVWNFRFLESETKAVDLPVVEAKLRQVGTRVAGTLVNRASFAMTNVLVRTAGGLARYGGPPIAPGAAVEIDLPLAADASPVALADPANATGTYYNYGQTIPPGTAPRPDYVRIAPLLPQRSRQIERWMKLSGDERRAIVYAELQSPEPPAKMQTPGAIEQHVALVRAAVTLE